MRPAARLALLALMGFGIAFDVAPSAAQDDAAALYEQGVSARRSGRHPEAIERFKRVLAAQPDNVDARLQLGLSLAAARRYNEARREFSRVLDKAPEYHDARVGLARLSFWQGRLAEAERELEPVRKNAPDNAEAKTLAEQIARAKRAGPQGRTGAAPAAASPVAQASDRRDEAAAQEAESARRRAAAAQFERTVLAARHARRAGRFAEAERAFRAAVARQPQDADLWTDLGLAIAFQGRFAEARPAFERALSLNPRAYDAVLGLARLDLYTNALDSAEARVAVVLAARPADRDAQALRARLRLARGDAEGAEAEFRALVSAHRGELDFLVGLGDALRAQQRDEEARAAYEAAQALDPTSIDVRNRLALRNRPRWRLDVDGGVSWLSRGLDPWQEGRIGLSYVVNARTTLSGAVEVSRRFQLVDVLLDARVDHRWSNRVTSYLRLGGTPDADFRPEFLAEAGGTVEIAPRSGSFGPTLALLHVGYFRYPTGEVKTISPGLQQYFFDGRLWLTGQLIRLMPDTGERLGGYRIRVDWTPTEQLGLFVGYADAPDVSEGKTFETRSVFGGVAYSFDESTTVRLSVAHEEREGSYDRTTLNVGFTVRF